MQELLVTSSFFVSIAHRYWVEEFSAEKNLELFGNSASHEGLGHDLEVSLCFLPSFSEARRLEVCRQVKKLWDHSSWIKTSPSECSSLEALTWDLVERFGEALHSVRVGESSKLWVEWNRFSLKKLTLVYARDLSVLWQEGGGARPRFHFLFEGEFETRKHVLFPRVLLERELEEALLKLELSDFTLSRDVKGNEKLMDALFKTLSAKLPLLASIECEMENQKKWLNHRPFATR